MLEGWLSYVEEEWLAKTVKTCDVIVELGVWKGRSTEVFCKNSNATIFSVDSWAEDRDTYAEIRTNREGIISKLKRDLEEYIDSGRLFILEMDVFKALDEILPKVLKHNKADLIYIDDRHDVAHVIRELRYCGNLIRPDGIICGHDYSEINEALKYFEHRVEADGLWRLL